MKMALDQNREVFTLDFANVQGSENDCKTHPFSFAFQLYQVVLSSQDVIINISTSTAKTFFESLNTYNFKWQRLRLVTK